eukprot:scaffold15921_cov58-Phaeocystis_antarctica.AAC.1
MQMLPRSPAREHARSLRQARRVTCAPPSLVPRRCQYCRRYRRPQLRRLWLRSVSAAAPRVPPPLPPPPRRAASPPRAAPRGRRAPRPRPTSASPRPAAPAAAPPAPVSWRGGWTER